MLGSGQQLKVSQHLSRLNMAQLKHVSTKGKLGVSHDDTALFILISDMALFYSGWFNNKLVAFNRFVGMLVTRFKREILALIRKKEGV